MKKLLTGMLVLTCSFLLWGCSKTEAPASAQNSSMGKAVDVLRVGFPPDENPQEIIAKNKPLLEYIKERTGIDNVELIVPESYTAAVEQMQQGKLDMVYFGGLTYVLAKKDVDITPLVRGKVGGTADNFTYIVSRADSGIDSVEKTKGKKFAFGDVASTSGHLIPHQALLAKGIDPTKDYADLVYTGAHDKTAMAVFNKEVDAGAMNSRKLPSMIKKGQLQENDLQIVWKSEPFADYPWAARTSLGNELLDKLKSAFVELNDTAILSNLGVEGYEATTDSDFANLRSAAIKLGFMSE